MITLLNTSIITAYGSYAYTPLTLDATKNLIKPNYCGCGGIPCLYCGGTGILNNGYQSAIGHESTAKIMTKLLGIPVEVNRQNYIQPVGEKAIVFKLKTRAPEGKILTAEEIEEIGYEFGLLVRAI